MMFALRQEDTSHEALWFWHVQYLLFPAGVLLWRWGGGGSCAKTECLWLCQYLWLVLIYLFIAENEGGGAETSPILLLSLNHSRYQINFTKQINLNIFGHRCTYSLTPIHKHTFIYKRIHTYSNIYQKKSLQQQPNNCFISIQAFH